MLGVPGPEGLHAVQHESMQHIFDECPGNDAQQRQCRKLRPAFVRSDEHQQDCQKPNSNGIQDEVGEITRFTMLGCQ